MTRPTIDETAMQIAQLWAKRSTCNRANVGAVIIRDGVQLGSGYNGSPKGHPHCTDPDQGCLMLNNHCVRCLHAEDNAITNATTQDLKGATLYVTHHPCPRCANRIAQKEIARVVYLGGYGGEAAKMAREILRRSQVTVELHGTPDIPPFWAHEVERYPSKGYDAANIILWFEGYEAPEVCMMRGSNRMSDDGFQIRAQVGDPNYERVWDRLKTHPLFEMSFHDPEDPRAITFQYRRPSEHPHNQVRYEEIVRRLIP